MQETICPYRYVQVEPIDGSRSKLGQSRPPLVSLLVLMVRMKHINARQALVDLERLAEFIGENEYLLARNALGDMS